MEKTTLSRSSAARTMIENLVRNGISQFFGVPGGPSAPIFEAIRVTPGVRFIDSRQESNALFAATSYYRETGKLAVVAITAGPGATNAASGIVSAHLERIPVLIITGDVPWANTGGIMAQDSGPDGAGIDHLYAHSTRTIERIYNGRSAVSQSMAAVNAALDPINPGPSIVILPIDKAMQEVPETKVDLQVTWPVFNLQEHYVIEALKLLAEARRPLLVLGGATKKDPELALELVNLTKLPFVTTPRAKGVVTETHPCSLRTGGIGASLWAKEYTAAGVDVCLVLGSDLDDSSVGPTPYVGPACKLIHVDMNARVFNRNFNCELAVNCDLETFTFALLRILQEQNIRLPDLMPELRKIKEKSPFDVPDFRTVARSPISPSRSIHELEAAMPETFNFITDIGGHMLMAFHYFTSTEKRKFNVHFNLGCMGSGITGSVGLATASPMIPVLCLAGDGGMQMNGMEVIVAHKHQLPIVFAVFNDGKYNIVHNGMKKIFGEAMAWDTPLMNFKVWAESMGVAGEVISEPGKITSELLKKLTANFSRPCVLDLRIDPEERLQGGGRAEVLQLSMLTSKKSE